MLKRNLNPGDDMKNIFISYCHTDEAWKNKLVSHLKILEKQKLCEIWHDRDIRLGEKWYPAIETALNSAHIAIMMISDAFLNSDFINKEEIPRLRQRREKQGLILIPLFLRHCAWQEVQWLNSLQGFPGDGGFVVEKDGADADVDKKLADFAAKIARMVKENEPGLSSASISRPVPPVQGQGPKPLPEEDLIKPLQARLIEKYDELDDALFTDTAKRLKQLAKKGIDETGREYIHLLEEFFDNRISDAEFEERAGGHKKAGAGENARETPDYDTLARLLKNGELIPFLGPGVLRLSGFPSPGSPGMVKKIAEKVRCPGFADFNPTLPMISQYCRGEKKLNRNLIIDELKSLMHRERRETGQPVDPGPLYQLLGEIKVPVLVVSTSYDDLLEMTFRRKGKRFAVVSQYALHETGGEIGKLQVFRSDKPTEADRLFTPEEISGLRLFDEGYSIIYKIFGHFCLAEGDKAPAFPRGSAGKTSPLLFEEEFFILSRILEKSIPEHFITSLEGSGFLFLGCDLHDWQDRMIAYVISKKWQNHKNSFCICQDPGAYERVFWKSLLSIDIYEAGLDEFVENLSQWMSV